MVAPAMIAPATGSAVLETVSTKISWILGTCSEKCTKFPFSVASFNNCSGVKLSDV